MTTQTHHRGNAERLGHWLGGIWRGYAIRERQAMARITARGVPAGGAAALLWVVKLAVLAVLLYAATWLALFVALVVVGAWVAGSGGKTEPASWAIGERADHKNSVFYDPRNYNDDPDSRFDD
ncbi:DUF3742 family protein [Burkholderia cepacia]|uniref:DUF3742 family protein n=1 Tax=Burkholderia cepacia TaxID=292 RepID=UPI002AB79C80|nr:DUF3742 family protein [Burkholderia cepacia]